MTVRSIYILEVLTKSFKLELMNPNQPKHGHSTRAGSLIPVPVHRTSKFKTSFNYKSQLFYNKIPKAWKELGSLKQFRNQVKKYLLSAELYSFEEFCP